ERILGVESSKAVAGKKRPVDLLFAILPAAPARDRRQEHIDVPLGQLLAHDLLMARARPDGKPARGTQGIRAWDQGLGLRRRFRWRFQALVVGLLELGILPLDDRLAA